MGYSQMGFQTGYNMANQNIMPGHGVPNGARPYYQGDPRMGSQDAFSVPLNDGRDFMGNDVHGYQNGHYPP